MSNRKWTNGVAPLRLQPDEKSALVMNIPQKSVVEATGETRKTFEQVVYATDGQLYTGWVYQGWLEAYVESFSKDCVDIPDQTADPRDAEQYFMFKGIKQTNICGEACVAFILGAGISEILDNWQRQKPSVWKSVFGTGKLRGTGYSELIGILGLFGRHGESLTDALRDTVIGRARYTVSGLQKLLENGNVIAGVNIDNSGRLKPSGIPHWIVVTAVHPERTGYGTVQIYNPFPNRIEIYSWNEFIESAKVPAGVFSPSVWLSS